jgi:CDP-diacylglycerol--glycerol-3-phosphate 3-phosphatidyltransferase
MKLNLNPAIWLTASRLVLFPLAVIPLALGFGNGGLISACVTQAAGLTDFADGIVARKMRQTTPLGVNLDLLCDKIFIGGMWMTLAWLGLVPVWVPVIVLAREAAVTAMRYIRFRWNPPSADIWGKAKTLVSFAAIEWVALNKDLSSGGLVAALDSHSNIKAILSAAPWLVWAAVALTVISGLNYFRKFAPGSTAIPDVLIVGENKDV